MATQRDGDGTNNPFDSFEQNIFSADIFWQSKPQIEIPPESSQHDDKSDIFQSMDMPDVSLWDAQEISPISGEVTKISKKKHIPLKIIMIMVWLIGLILLGIGIFNLVSKQWTNSTNPTIPKKQIQQTEKKETEVKSDEVWTITNDLSFTNDSSSWELEQPPVDTPQSTNIWYQDEVISSWGVLEEDFVISVTNSTEDNQMNTNLALLGNYWSKISTNTLGDFEWSENNEQITQLTTQDEKNIPSVNRMNYIPDIQVTILNKENVFKVSDSITLEYQIILNSRSLKYNATTKQLWENLVINISPLLINSPLVSMEENLVKEKIEIPTEIMNRGEHIIWIKFNNVTKTQFKYTIK